MAARYGGRKKVSGLWVRVFALDPRMACAVMKFG